VQRALQDFAILPRVHGRSIRFSHPQAAAPIEQDRRESGGQHPAVTFPQRVAVPAANEVKDFAASRDERAAHVRRQEVPQLVGWRPLSR